MSEQRVRLTAEDIPKIVEFLKTVGGEAINLNYRVAVGGSALDYIMDIDHEGLHIQAGFRVIRAPDDSSMPTEEITRCSWLMIECHEKTLAGWGCTNDFVPWPAFDDFCRKLLDRRKRFAKTHPTESELAAARQELTRILGR